MGVSANLLINSRHGVQDVVKVLEAIGATKIETEPKVDHAFVRFDWQGESRQLYVARSTEYGGLDGTILSFSQWGGATTILQRIAAITGGFLCESDCGDTWTGFQAPHNGNARFILVHQILTEGLTQRDAEKLADRVAEATGYQRVKLNGGGL